MTSGGYEHLLQVSKPQCQFKFSALSALSALRGFPAASGALLGPTEWQSACPAALPWCCSTRSIRAALPQTQSREKHIHGFQWHKKGVCPFRRVEKARLLFESGPVASPILRFMHTQRDRDVDTEAWKVACFHAPLNISEGQSNMQ